MKTKLLVSAAVCALALSSMSTYATSFNHSYGGHDFKKVDIKEWNKKLTRGQAQGLGQRPGLGQG